MSATTPTPTPTYYVEANVPGKGLMMDSGLTAEQVQQLRDAQSAGRITGLVVECDTDLSAAFRNGSVLN